jgi:tRNA threonylcarbamoyladenosine biosynthesis protein TsaE
MKIDKSYQLILPSEADSERFAIHIADLLKMVSQNCPDNTFKSIVFGFSGEIGMGKTTIIRKFLTSMGVKDRIKSPTFSIVESYKLDNLCFHHFDLYRIHVASELDYIGFRDYFLNNTISCIEWPENLGDYSLDLDIIFTISRHGEGRMINCRSKTQRGNDFLETWLI